MMKMKNYRKAATIGFEEFGRMLKDQNPTAAMERVQDRLSKLDKEDTEYENKQ